MESRYPAGVGCLIRCNVLLHIIITVVGCRKRRRMQRWLFQLLRHGLQAVRLKHTSHRDVCLILLESDVRFYGPVGLETDGTLTKGRQCEKRSMLWWFPAYLTGLSINSIIHDTRLLHIAWWRHQLEIFSALLAIYEGTPQVTGAFPSQRPVMRSFDVFFDVSQLSSYRWFETPWGSLWRHCNGCCIHLLSNKPESGLRHR